MSRRLFTAIQVQPNREMKELLDYLKKFDSTKTVEPENLHVNLKFLGEQPEEKVKKAKEALKKLKTFKSFKMKLEETGAFPNEDFIKVIWIGVNSPEIRKLARETEKKYLEKGFQGRDKNYKPHVTMARVKSKPDPEIREVFKDRFNKHYKDLHVNEVELLESELKKTGPEYKTLKKVKLED